MPRAPGPGSAPRPPSPAARGCPPTTPGCSRRAATSSCTSPRHRSSPGSPPSRPGARRPGGLAAPRAPRRRRTPPRAGRAVIAPTPPAAPRRAPGGAHRRDAVAPHDVTPGRPYPDVAGAALAELHVAWPTSPAPSLRLTPVHDQVDDGLAGIRAAGCSTGDARRPAPPHAAALAGICPRRRTPTWCCTATPTPATSCSRRSPDGPALALDRLRGGLPRAGSPGTSRCSPGRIGATPAGPRALAAYAAASGTAGARRRRARPVRRRPASRGRGLARGMADVDPVAVRPPAVERSPRSAPARPLTPPAGPRCGWPPGAVAGFRDVVGRVLQAGLTCSTSSGAAGRSGPRRLPRRDRGRLRTAETRERRPHVSYAPDMDGAADPGEIVWTWVPFEEDPAQGKDRPVLVVARADGDSCSG